MTPMEKLNTLLQKWEEACKRFYSTSDREKREALEKEMTSLLAEATPLFDLI